MYDLIHMDFRRALNEMSVLTYEIQYVGIFNCFIKSHLLTDDD